MRCADGLDWEDSRISMNYDSGDGKKRPANVLPNLSPVIGTYEHMRVLRTSMYCSDFARFAIITGLSSFPLLL